MTRIDYPRLTAAIQAIDFDHPFTLTVDGVLDEAPGAYAPEVVHVENDPLVDLEIHGDWHTILHGFTQQYGYRGPVMHASEQIGEGIVGRLLAEAEAHGGTATFVTVAVIVLPTEDDPDPEPAGWTIMCRDHDEDAS